MSVYKKENSKYLKTALDSVINQTLQPDEIVLIQDGELTEDLYKIISEYQTRYPEVFRTYALNKNQGLGKALNFGLEKCKHEIVARMDTDDIAVPVRFELQIKEFVIDKNLVLCGGQIAEFENTPEMITSYRNVPVDASEIEVFAKKRNPFNHMTVMFKKSKVLEAGSYEDMPYFEDYWLWLRMLKAGNKMKNIKQILVYMRAGQEMIVRRGGWQYVKHIYSFEKSVLELGVINIIDFCWITMARCLVALVPDYFRKHFYRKCLRNVSSK